MQSRRPAQRHVLTSSGIKSSLYSERILIKLDICIYTHTSVCSIFNFVVSFVMFNFFVWVCLLFFFSSFLAATKQLYEWFSPSVCPSVRLSVCPSVCLSHLFDYVPIILSSWNFQELLPVTKVTSMQKVKVRGQRSRSQRSQPNLTVSGL